MNFISRLRIRFGDSFKRTLAQILPSHILPPGFDRPSNLEIGRFDGFDIAYRRGTADERVIAESFSHDRLLVGTPEIRLSRDAVVVDVGAHIGTFALLVSTLVPDGCVHAIEPSGDTYNLLRINASLNQATNIAPHHLALGEREGTQRLYHESGNWGHSTVAKSKRSEIVPATGLAQFFDSQKITACAFLKFNCEGAEFPILFAAPLEYLRRVDLLLILYHEDLWQQHSAEDLIRHLSNAGFKAEIRNRSGHRGWIVASRSN